MPGRRSSARVARPAAAAIGLPLSVPACWTKPASLHLLREVPHDVAAARDRGERKAAADDLAERGQVRHDAVVLLRAPVGEAEAGDDLVEDQRHAVSRGDLAHALEEAGLGHHQPLQRLQDHRGQVVVMRLDHGLGLGHVVEGRDQDLALDGVGNARRVRGGGGERLGRPRAPRSSGSSRGRRGSRPRTSGSCRAGGRRGPRAGRRTSPRCRCRRTGPARRRGRPGRSPRPGPGWAR